MELAGTGQMWAVPGTAASTRCRPASPAMVSPAVEKGGSGMAVGLCLAVHGGGEGEHPQVRCGGGWWELWAPFLKRWGGGWLRG